MRDFYLLMKPECPLCTLAIQHIHGVPLEDPIALHMVDITTDPALFQEYGALVPVLVRDMDDKELKWPFETEKLQEFLEQ
ncbi:MAG: glutaredoxin family protein [Idiomarina sp.]|nr:glutaredoxin family protein [Idiomarina sp.]